MPELKPNDIDVAVRKLRREIELSFSQGPVAVSIKDLFAILEALERVSGVITDTQKVLTHYPPFDKVTPGKPEHLVSQITCLCNYYKASVENGNSLHERLGRVTGERDAAAKCQYELLESIANRAALVDVDSFTEMSGALDELVTLAEDAQSEIKSNHPHLFKTESGDVENA